MNESDFKLPESNDLKPLLAQDGEPVFEQAWQAQALAIADNLVASGMFSASSWSATLGDMLAQAKAERLPDTPVTYYNAVLAALEQLVANNSEIELDEISTKRDDWENAYRSTPHGKPVNLSR